MAFLLNDRMAKPKKPRYRLTYIKQWRISRGLNQERLADRIGMTQSQVSMLENGERGYTQETLEAVAEALQTDPASLLMRNPTDPEGMWSIWDQAKEGQKRVIRNLAETVVKTGT